LLGGEVHDLGEGRLDLWVLHPLFGSDHDLSGEPGPVWIIGLEQLLDVLGLTVREHEVRPPVGADPGGDGVDADEQSQPHADDDPAVAQARAREGGKHG
jgi:hypothetical protein